ncbi:glycosyl hydrolase, family 1 [Streptomyces sp. SPB074]|nr:glycosyl hydrolase, family 1 [Streptomyces sp. SPB074]
MENMPDSVLPERSGDALDSSHRWPEDMDLLCRLGFNAYRFSVEWARIEPEEGHVSRAAVAHYRAMVLGARARGLEPVVTLHHFSSPRWFSARGGWLAEDAAAKFAAYARVAVEILGDEVRYVATINEPNMVALLVSARRRAASDDSAHSGGSTGIAGLGRDVAAPEADVTAALVRAHRAASGVLGDAGRGYLVGWTVANQVYQPEPGAEEATAAYARPRETVFIEAAREDDWIGVQVYTRHRVGPDGPLPLPDDAETTLMGWEFYPQALGEAVRETARVAGPGVAILVTENGIATSDDTRRIAYTEQALASLVTAIREGADVRGYLHWTALDNYEWGSYRPTFGLIAVDRETFARTPKPSARWLGSLAREGSLPCAAPAPAGASRAAR